MLSSCLSYIKVNSHYFYVKLSTEGLLTFRIIVNVLSILLGFFLKFALILSMTLDKFLYFNISFMFPFC